MKKRNKMIAYFVIEFLMHIGTLSKANILVKGIAERTENFNEFDIIQKVGIRE